MKLPETSAFPTTGKKGGKRKKAGPPAWIFRRKPRICSRKILILPFYGKGIYGKSFWILRSKKPANPHEYWQKWGRHLKCLPQMVGEGGFEPPKSVTTDLQSAPFGHSGTPPYEIGAGGRTRTPDLLITNQLLYQLSYTSVFRCFTRDFVLFLYLSLTAHI